jgi:hypothetical protein
MKDDGGGAPGGLQYEFGDVLSERYYSNILTPLFDERKTLWPKLKFISPDTRNKQ